MPGEVYGGGEEQIAQNVGPCREASLHYDSELARTFPIRGVLLNDFNDFFSI